MLKTLLPLDPLRRRPQAVSTEIQFKRKNALMFLRQSSMMGKFHDQGDTKWIVIRRSLWGHNDTPCGWPAPGRPIGRPGSGHPQGVMGGFSYYQLVILISNIIFQHCPPDRGIHLTPIVDDGDQVFGTRDVRAGGPGVHRPPNVRYL
jgi:hypothetical protein